MPDMLVNNLLFITLGAALSSLGGVVAVVATELKYRRKK